MELTIEQGEMVRKMMMKKSLMIVLVFSMTGMAIAGYMITMPDVVEWNSSFQIVISVVGDEIVSGSVYGDIMPTEVVSDCWIQPLPDVGGVDFVLGTCSDWIALTYPTDNRYSLTFDFYDYDVSFAAPVATRTVSVIPEPMSLILLGLGGLMIRRR